MPFQDYFESTEINRPRNLIFSIISGFVFALAWWIAFSAAARYSNESLPGAFHTPGVFSTLAFLLINIIPNSALQDDYGERLIGRRGAFLCLFFAFLMAFSCVIASTWILFGAYVAAGKNAWPGVSIFMQNILICSSSLLYRFGRKEED